MVQLVERRIIHAGEREYELVPNWGQLPDGWHWGQCAGVAIDSEDNVHVYTRTEHPYMVFDKTGKFIDSWGENDFGMAHSLWINPDDSLYVLSHKDHWIRKFDKNRKPLIELGKKGVASDTQYTKEQRAPGSPWLSGAGMPTYNGVGKSAGPFNEPTSIAQQPNNGFIFLSDGYKNARVHKFSPDGQLVKSWGEPGNAQENRNTKNNPNHFHTPHGIGVYGDRVFVCDREHNRIQVFSQDGDFLDIWTMMERPTDMHIDKDGIVYISELEDHVSIRDVQGNEIGRFGSERSHEPGKFWGPHAIWVDSEDNLYVGEVLEGQRVQKFARFK
jgi:DNA-binding beta-propeller fold protein YncE